MCTSPRYSRKSSLALEKSEKEEVRSEAVKDIKNSATTFMLGIDRHFEGILSKINFSNVDPLAVDVVLVDVITAHGDACAAQRMEA